MRLYPAALSKLFLPTALISVAGVGRPFLDNLNNDAHVLVESMPYLFCVVAALMAHQFNRNRMLLAVLGTSLFYWTAGHYLQVNITETAAIQTYLAICLTLPVLTLFLLLVPERGIWNPYGLAFSGAFLLLGLICVQLGPWLAQVNATASAYYAPNPSEHYVLSLGSTVLFAFVALVGFVLICVRNEEVDVALLSAMTALYLALALLPAKNITVAMCTAAALCLVWGLLRSSHAMAYRDELTGVPGRRALNERLKAMSGNFCIAMLDIDHFKRFNDTYGHEVGDEVLKLVASRICRVGGGGTAYRYGGEEFCIVFPRRNLDEALGHLEQVREEIASYSISLRNHTLRPARRKEGARKRGATRLGGDQVSVTISAGIATRTAEHPDVEHVIAAADKKLYQAKKAGRNRVAC